MSRCQRCGEDEATVTVTGMDGGEEKTAEICDDCWFEALEESMRNSTYEPLEHGISAPKRREE